MWSSFLSLYDTLHYITEGTTSTPTHTHRDPLVQIVPAPAATSCAVSAHNEPDRDIKVCRALTFLPLTPLSSKPLPLHGPVLQLPWTEAAVGLQQQQRCFLVSCILQVHHWDLLISETSTRQVTPVQRNKLRTESCVSLPFSCSSNELQE